MPAKVKFTRETVQYLDSLISEYAAVEPVFLLHRLSVRDHVAALKSIKTSIESKGEIDWSITLHLSVNVVRAFRASIEHCALTGEPYFTSVYDAADWLRHDGERRAKAQKKIAQANEDRQAKLWQERDAAQRKKEQQTLAEKLGINPVQLAKLQSLEVE